MVFVLGWRRSTRLILAVSAIAFAWESAVWAQGQGPAPRPKTDEAAKPAEPAKPAAPTKPSESAIKPGDSSKAPNDPVAAIVEGHVVFLSDIGRSVPTLPESLRNLPFETLYPVVLDRIIDHEALVLMARRQHLENDPAVQREIEAATERILEGAVLSRAAAPQVSEEAIQARYTKQYVGRPSTEETRARHILVSTEAEARKLIDELNKGADFPTLAKERSKDPDSASGGDLGFFRRDQVWPEFADVAFALPPGQFSQTPIHNEFGWHVVKVEERRIVAPPTYSEVHDALRRTLMPGSRAARHRAGAQPDFDQEIQFRWLGDGGGARHHASATGDQAGKQAAA